MRSWLTLEARPVSFLHLPCITRLFLHRVQGPQRCDFWTYSNEQGCQDLRVYIQLLSLSKAHCRTLLRSRKHGGSGVNLAMFLQCDAHRKENFPHSDVLLFQVLPDLALHLFSLPKHVFVLSFSWHYEMQWHYGTEMQ